MLNFAFVHPRHSSENFGILRGQPAIGFVLRKPRCSGLHLESGLHIGKVLRQDNASLDQGRGNAGEHHEKCFFGLRFDHPVTLTAASVESTIRPDAGPQQAAAA